MANLVKQIKKDVAVAIPQADLNNWGASPMSAKDLVIPRIDIIQAMSKKALTGKAIFGELRDSLNNELLATPEKEMEVIPFNLEPMWVEYTIAQEGNKKKKNYKRTLAIDSDPTSPGYNDELPFSDVVEGIEIERYRVLSFHVLIADHVKAGAALPHILPFRSSSLKAGKKLATQMYVSNANAGKVPPATVMSISVQKVTNDDGTFAVLDVNTKRASNAEEIAEAFKWFKLVKKGGVKSAAVTEEADEKPTNLDDTPF